MLRGSTGFKWSANNSGMVMPSVVDLFLCARRLSLALRGHDGMGKCGGAWHGKPSIV